MLSITMNSIDGSDMPILNLTIDDVTFPFLVDTGATISSLGVNYEGPITNKCIESVGIEGVSQTNYFTPPLTVTCSSDSAIFMQHPFVYMPDCPFNLLGRDLMQKLHEYCISGLEAHCLYT